MRKCPTKGHAREERFRLSHGLTQVSFIVRKHDKVIHSVRVHGWDFSHIERSEIREDYVKCPEEMRGEHETQRNPRV